MAKASGPVVLLISASTLLVVLMVLAGPRTGRAESEGDSGEKAASTSLQDVVGSVSDLQDQGNAEVPEHLEFMPQLHVGVAMGQVKPLARCSQSNSNLYSLLLPCAALVQDPSRPSPSSACCQGVKAVTDGCFCYLETFIDGNPLGLTLENVLHFTSDCGRDTVKC